MLRDGFLLLYCTAVGFVASGIAASFYKMVTHEPARFAMLGSGWFAAVATFLFCAVTGPAIVMDMVIKHRLGDREGAGGDRGGRRGCAAVEHLLRRHRARCRDHASRRACLRRFGLS